MITIYRTKGEWRWRLKSKNGRIVAASSEGFKTRAGCVRNLVLTRDMLAVLNCWGE